MEADAAGEKEADADKAKAAEAVAEKDETPPIKSALNAEETVADLLMFNLITTTNEVDG